MTDTTQPPAETLAEREAIVAAITKADANFGYSYRLTKMDDTGEEHTLLMDGFEPAVFEYREDGYPVIEQRRNAARTDAILAALTRRAGGDAIERWMAERPLAASYDDNRQYQVAVMAWEKRRPPSTHLPAGGDAGATGCGFTVKLDNWMTVSVEDGDLILRNEAGEPIAFGKLGQDAKFPDPDAPEPFGYWVEQKHADPVLLRKPAYIPEPSDLRTVTPLYATPKPPAGGDAIPATEREALLTKALQRISAEPLHSLPIVTTQRMRNIADFALLGEDLA